MGVRGAVFAWMCLWPASAAAQGVTVSSTGAVHPTLAAAVQAAAVGDTLHVAPGVYPESVRIDRDLVIEGAGASQVAVTGAQSVVLTVEPGVDLTLRDLAVASPSLRALEASLGATVRLERVDLDASGGGDGGAVRLSGSDLTGEDVRFLGRAPAALGGALYATGAAANGIDLTRATFSMQGHAAARGGAIYVDGVDLRCVDCVFEDAAATGQGGAIHSNAFVELRGGAFRGSSAESGGAVYVNGGGLYVADTAFVGNGALLRGGAVQVEGEGPVEIVRALFCDNGATLGGAFHGSVEQHGRIASVRFVENTATSGGALLVTGSGAWSLENLTAVGNKSGSNGTLQIVGSTAFVVNSLFSGNFGYAIERDGNLSPQIHSPAFHSNSLGDLQNAIVASGGMYGVDPQLVAYSFDGDCSNDDLWPSPVSPLIDAGSPDPAYRDPDGSLGDIGAYGGPDADPSRHLVDADGDGRSLLRDCDDADPRVHADADELCNLVDDDCDGVIDEDALDRAVWYPDEDGDGFGDWSAGAGVPACFPPPGWVQDWTDCDDTDAGIHPGAPEICNALDLNCDGDPHRDAIDAPTWSLDGDGDGYGAVGTGVVACANPFPGVYVDAPDMDCDDTRPAVHPGAEELCDGVDDNCSGDESDAEDPTAWHLDADGDGHGAVGAEPVWACAPPPHTSATADDCDDTRPHVHPGAPELCDGLDDDCNGVVDDGGEPVAWYPDADGDGFGGEGLDVRSWCPPEPEGWLPGPGGDCDDFEPEAFPGAPELCDGVDNDCDGLLDDDDPDVKGTLAWADADGDGFGAGTGGLVCDLDGRATRQGDCNDHDAAIHPDAEEIPGNDVDEDCDGRIDAAGGEPPTALESRPGGWSCDAAGGAPGGSALLLLAAAVAVTRRSSRGAWGAVALASCAVAPSEPDPAPPPPDPAAVLADVEARVHRVRGVPVDGVDEAWQLLAPGVRAWFLDDGRVVARPRRDDGSWRVDLRFEGWGRDGALRDAPLRATRAEGRRLEQLRDGITEWYVGRGDAIEQGFTLTEPPPGRGPVALALQVAGADRATLRDGEVSFVSGGRHRLRYGGLFVTDADGAELPSWMELEGCGAAADTCRLWLRFADEGARWPVTVDPLLTGLEALLSGGPGGFGNVASAGASVDLDGNWAIAGAPNGGGLGGRASILQRDRANGVGHWQSVAVLQQPFAQAFGEAVAIEYPYAAVGAPGSGEVHVYEAVDPQTWLRVRTLTHPGGAGAEFGAALDLSAEILVVGDPGQANGGEVHVYAAPHPDAVAAPWTHLATYTMPQAPQDARFGAAVSVDGHRFAAGAPGFGWAAIHERDTAGGASYPRRSAVGSAGDFGRAVALDGEWLLVGGGGAAPHLYRRRSDGQGWALEAQLPAPHAPGDQLGVSVALDGSRLFALDRHGAATLLHVWDRDRSQPGTLGYLETQEVGARGANRPPALAARDGTLLLGLPEEPISGGVAFFRAETDEIVPWGVPVQGQAMAHVSGAAAGAAVAVEGDFIAIGAPGSDLFGFGAGAVTLLARYPQSWNYAGVLSPPFPLPNVGAGFGARLAMDDGRLLVGAPGVDAVVADAGAAYLYHRPNLPYTWVLTRTLTAPAPVAGQRFGAAVALEHDLAAVGAPGRESVYVYGAHAPGAAPAWNLIAQLSAPNVGGFGGAVAVDAPFLAIGAPLDDLYGQDAGSVRVYRWDAPTGAFQPDATLGSGAAAGGELGHSVALEGGRLAAGAPGASAGAGAAWVWAHAGAGWSRLGASSPPGQGAGASVALEGAELFVGAPGSEEVFVYELASAAQPQLARVVQPSAGAVGFGASVDVDADLVVVGAPGGPADPGDVHVYQRRATLPPVALADVIAATEDQPRLVAPQDLLANDWDHAGQAITIASFSAPEHGALDAVGNVLRYVPAPDHHGTDTFTYTITNGSRESSPATVTLEIQPVNDACVAVADGPFEVLEDHAFAAPVNVLANDVDPDHGGPHPGITGWVTIPPAHGNLTFNGGAFTYLPEPDWHGSDGFTYVCADEHGAVSAARFVPIEVLPVNDPPVVPTPDIVQVAEDTPLAAPPPGVLAAAYDVDGDVLEAQLVAGPARGVLTLRPNGSYDYAPPPGVSGVQDAFVFRAWDGEAASAPVTVTLLLVAHDDPPVGVPDLYLAIEDRPLDVPAIQGVLANDVDEEGAALTAHLVTSPVHGSLTLLADGSFSYVPSAEFSGEDTFTYQATDGGGISAETPVRIVVREVDDPPWAGDDAYDWTPEGLVVGPAEGVLANDGDPEGLSVLVHAVVKQPTWGELALEADGAFTYRPDPGFEGRDTFTYVVTDGALLSLPALVAIEVRDNPRDDTGDGSGGAGCDSARYWLDRDGDGWGDEAAPVEACGPEPLLASRPGDCDDADASVHPEAREVAQDGVDQDCDGDDAVVRPLGACSSSRAPVAGLLVVMAIGAMRRREGACWR